MRSFMFAIAAICAFAQPGHCEGIALSDALNGFAKQKFGTTSSLVIGDTVDVLDPTTPRERCITFNEIKADTKGAVKSKINYHFIRNLNQFENTFKISYSVEASSKANYLKILKGESSLEAFGSFENLLKQDNDSVLILIEAVADHGRDMIQDFSLGTEYKELITKKKFAEFRKRCGTHFVRGWNKKSEIKVYIQITNLSREAKAIIDNTIKAKMSGEVTIADVGGAEATTKASSTVHDALRLASKLGKVTAWAEATGGSGIPTVTSIATSGDLSDSATLAKLYEEIRKASDEFSIDNSSPEEFIIIPHPEILAEQVEYNAVNYEKLGDIYHSLVRVDQRLADYDTYKLKDMELWEKYFRVYDEELRRLRKDLVLIYQKCRDQGECSVQIPSIVQGLLIDDFMADGKLYTKCFYDFEHEDKVAGNTVERFKYLSSISVIWKGVMKFRPQIDEQSAEALRLTPDFTLKNTLFDPVKQQRIGADGRAYIEVYRQTIDHRGYDTDGDVKIDELRGIRKQVGTSVYIMRYLTTSGFQIDQVLGFPMMESCPAYITK